MSSSDRIGVARAPNPVAASRATGRLGCSTWLASQTPAFRDRIEVVAMDGFGGYKTAAAEQVPEATAASGRNASTAQAAGHLLVNQSESLTAALEEWDGKSPTTES